jgi:hypothetical protein
MSRDPKVKWWVKLLGKFHIRHKLNEYKHSQLYKEPVIKNPKNRTKKLCGRSKHKSEMKQHQLNNFATLKPFVTVKS